MIVRSLIDQNPGGLASFAEGPGIREDKGFTMGSDQKGFHIGWRRWRASCLWHAARSLIPPHRWPGDGCVGPKFEEVEKEGHGDAEEGSYGRI